MQINIPTLFKKLIGSRLMSSLMLASSVAIMSAALAEYQPPDNQKPPSGKTSSTFTRDGCQGNQSTSLTALAPQEHVGQTASTRPTFAWFIPDSQPYPIEFRLNEHTPDGKREILLRKELQSEPGIMVLSLSEEEIELSVGQRYSWQVIVFCNPNRPSSALVVGADVDVVEMPLTLANHLSATNNSVERANLYAQSGLWYDALGQVLETREVFSPNQFELTLLEDLAQVEGSESVHSQRLRQIIEAEQQPQSYKGSEQSRYNQLPMRIKGAQ